MSTNWEIGEEKDREKEKVRRQASEAQREKELERDRKNKGGIFCWRNSMKFCSGGEKMRNASGHLGENERQRKKVNKNTYDISSIKRVTRKLLDVSHCSRTKQQQRNVQSVLLVHFKCPFA